MSSGSLKMQSAAAVFAISVAMAACMTSPTSSPGELKAEKLRSPKAADTSMDAQSHSAVIPVGPAPSKVQVDWQTFAHQGGRHIDSFNLSVIEAAPGFTIEAGAVGALVNTGSHDEPMAELPVMVTYRGNKGCGTLTGTVLITIRADGSHTAG